MTIGVDLAKYCHLIHVLFTKIAVMDPDIFNTMYKEIKKLISSMIHKTLISSSTVFLLYFTRVPLSLRALFLSENRKGAIKEKEAVYAIIPMSKSISPISNSSSVTPS
jgi:hypothetical protein